MIWENSKMSHLNLRVILFFYYLCCYLSLSALWALGTGDSLNLFPSPITIGGQSRCRLLGLMSGSVGWLFSMTWFLKTAVWGNLLPAELEPGWAQRSTGGRRNGLGWRNVTHNKLVTLYKQIQSLQNRFNLCLCGKMGDVLHASPADTFCSLKLGLRTEDCLLNSLTICGERCSLEGGESFARLPVRFYFTTAEENKENNLRMVGYMRNALFHIIYTHLAPPAGY